MLVANFSRSGNTREIANQIHKMVGHNAIIPNTEKGIVVWLQKETGQEYKNTK
jgi:hypothetical protein